MQSNRADILDWTDQGRIAPDNLRPALELAGVLPDAARWRRFIDRTLLFIGVAALAAGVIFFFAFNWQALGRLAKFALIEFPILAAIVFIWRLGVDSLAGKATVLLACLLVGALLALVGQTYQTGADTFELFIAWAAAILPWVLVARFAALWVVWIVLVNIALAFYFLTLGRLWGMLFAPERLLWLLFGLNTAALAIWEGLARGGLLWLREERWSVRLLATASGAFATALAVKGIVGWGGSSHWGVPAWCAWIAAAYVVYRHLVKDVYVLAGGVLSVIVVITTFLGKRIGSNDAGAFLLIGLLVIGLSAAGGFWLKQVAAKEES